MSAAVRITLLARNDILQAQHYFSGISIELSEAFTDEMMATLERIADMPLNYGEVDTGIRGIGVRRFGYVVYDRTHGTNVEVIAVLHGSRSPEVWQERASH